MVLVRAQLAQLQRPGHCHRHLELRLLAGLRQLELELRRRLSKGFSANLNYQYAFEGGSQFDGFSFGRAWTDLPVTGNPTVRHAIKFQGDWTLPFGRGERFGSDMHPVLNAIAGGWSITGVGRIPNRDYVLTFATPQWSVFNANLLYIGGQDENFYEWAQANIHVASLTVNARLSDRLRERRGSTTG